MNRASSDPKKILVFDTTCLNHFALAERLDDFHYLLPDTEFWTTQIVMAELQEGAVERQSLAAVMNLDWIEIAQLDTPEEIACHATWERRMSTGGRDRGEASVFATAELLDGIAVTDDRNATKVGRYHGIEVHGTIWLLAGACQNGQLTEVAAGNLINDLRTSGHRLPCTGSEFPQYARRSGLM